MINNIDPKVKLLNLQNDQEFDKIYPIRLRKLADIHFTPIEVAKIAAQFLADRRGAKILDIGSGAGKFCVIGSIYSKGNFVGVEHRQKLWKYSVKMAKQYHLSNVQFLYANILDIPFGEFEGIYFFNSFFENFVAPEIISPEVQLSVENYRKYADYVRNQLDLMPVGTKLATYFNIFKEVPESYKVKMTHFDGKLKLWEKTV